MRKERDIRSRVLFVALAPVIATAIALALYFTLLRYNDVESALQQRGVAMARQLAPAAQYGLFSGNVTELNRLTQALSHEPDVSAVTVYDQYGIPLVATGKAIASPPPLGLQNGWHGQGGNGKVLSFHNKVFASSLPLDDPYAEKASTPARNLMLGSITIELSRDNLLARKREILSFTLASTLLILLVAGSIASRLGRDITEPILSLEHAVRRIREGALSARVPPHAAGTLRTLEEGVNTMAAALERAQRRSKEALMSSNTQLEQQNNFANALLDAQSSAGVSMIIVENEKVLFSNSAAEAFACRTGEELKLLGSFTDMLAPQSKVELQRLYQTILRGGDFMSRIEVNLIRPDGTDVWAEVATFAITRSNSPQIVMLGVDITQRKLDAEQLLQTHRELQAQKDAAELASAAKSRFLAAASHDLRQPLHALSLFSDQLQEQVKTPTQYRLARQIDAAIGNMSGLLESLLDISKLDLTTLVPEPRAIEIGPFLAQIAEAHRHTAENKHLRMVVAPSSLWIRSDPRYLSRIIANLLSNAVSYTHQGGILVGARRSADKVRIEIWDTGIGIAQEHIPHLFNEFYQVANPERDAAKGLGLGLAMVERIAGLLGHEVCVHSSPDKGSVFTVTVPRASEEDATPNTKAIAKHDLAILLSIGNAGQRAELTELIEAWGYRVSISAPEAIALHFADVPPDLIICDAAGDEIFAAQAANNTPIIVLASDAEVADKQLAGCARLDTPLKPAKLRALILHLTAQET